MGDIINGAQNIVTATTTVPDGPKGVYASPSMYPNNSLGTPTFGGAIGNSFTGGASAALPVGFKSDAVALSDYRLGTFLQNHNLITGSEANMINGVVNFIKANDIDTKPTQVTKFSYSDKFLPIVIKAGIRGKIKGHGIYGDTPGPGQFLQDQPVFISV